MSHNPGAIDSNTGLFFPLPTVPMDIPGRNISREDLPIDTSQYMDLPPPRAPTYLGSENPNWRNPSLLGLAPLNLDLAPVADIPSEAGGPYTQFREQLRMLEDELGTLRDRRLRTPHPEDDETTESSTTMDEAVNAAKKRCYPDTNDE
jgi:hypothetical protein